MLAAISERMSLLNSGEGNPMFGQKHDEETLEYMRENYSDARREQIGKLNRGKPLSPETRELLRQAALARPPMSNESRAKVSANHATVMQIEITEINDPSIPPYTARGILHAAEYMSCGEKTVRVALKGNGTVKKTYRVRVLSRGQVQ